MNFKIFVVLAGIALLAGGCRKTETDTHTFQPWFGKDRAYGRYPRSVEEVYRAAFTVVGRNGVVVNETIPHDTSNNARALYGKVGENKVWMSVQSEEDPKITSIIVQAHTKWGNANIELAHELEKEVALQLQSQSPSSSPSGS